MKTAEDEPVAMTEEPANPSPQNSRGRARAFTIFFIVLLLVAAGAFLFWMHTRQFESTDDAFIEMHLDPVTPRIDGTIVKVYVENNLYVHAGDPLVDLDPRDYQVALDQALASLSQARSQVTAQQPNIPITQVENTANISSAEASVASARAALGSAEHDRDSAAARLAEAEANSARAQADLARYKILIAAEEVSQQEYDQVEAAAKAQAANVAGSRAAVESAARVVDQRRAQIQEASSRVEQYQQNATQQIAIRRAAVRTQEANSQSAAAQVEQARLKLGYTKLVAPVDGIVMKRSAEVGAHVSAGQQLFTIAQTGDLWVTANFKETQLNELKAGQTARIHVDALRRDFDGYVEDIGGGTGAVSSVLPPENATGNYVKVVQRIPVRLRLRPNQTDLDRLRAGMSVEPEVRIR
ncbi:MAG TPA: HlyD family secretion protein [Bryobacteraceae bacterium]|nr:HlyD family secretion protein [Bryobacteraceae bacterium]